MRRFIRSIRAIACLALAGATLNVQAAEPITLIVPFPPGGSQDAMGRFFAKHLATELGTPVVVKNDGGAGGVIATSEVARAKGDGRTLLLATGGAITIAPHILKKLPYNVERDLAPVALIADTPMAIGVKADSPIQTLQDLLDAARREPGTLSYASTGHGTVSNLAAELLSQKTGARLLHIPYRGAGPALVDLLGDQVNAIFTSTASLAPMVRTGKLRLLATFSKTADGTLTVAQTTGDAALDVPIWVGVMASRATSPELLAQLGQAIANICRTADTGRFLAELEATARCGDHDTLGQTIARDDARWKAVVARAPDLGAQ